MIYNIVHLLIINPSSSRSDKVCKRPWNFERVPNKMIDGHDKALIFTSTKEACLAACLNEVSFFNFFFWVSLTMICHWKGFYWDLFGRVWHIQSWQSYRRIFLYPYLISESEQNPKTQPQT